MRDDLVSRKAVIESLTKEYNRRIKAGDRGGLKLAWIEKAVDDVDPADDCRTCKYLENEFDDGPCINCVRKSKWEDDGK